jgi:hypothetical protein
MRTLFNGRIFDTEKLQKIYSDGRFSSRGVDVYITANKQLLALPWSRWQGDCPDAYLLEVEDFLKFPHPDRVLAAVEEHNLIVLDQIL